MTISVRNRPISRTVPVVSPSAIFSATRKGRRQQQHHARRDIGQRALQRQADGQAGRAQQGDQRGGLHPELAQHRDQVIARMA